ncbi:DUF2183 domain-containing protein [Aliiglaciecola sp. CAU 1673]|uniref:phosphatidate phosphatase App1 family protein n=1 Tax=Aliiglaciecola sp. CAU 1673 TaxID=3032595 RepID=UPI0023DA24DA|nr:phosphatase domain-containing protein [Aliiglaciecola sp. CAU 1673]MDF2177628.1 DUF2183 domain-containing protein [Aliiglaciecola sp. CAU 1673]
MSRRFSGWTIASGFPGLLSLFNLQAADVPSFPLSEDETVVFFPSDASFDANRDQWQIPIHGWVYQNPQSVARKALAASLLEGKYQLRLTAEIEPIFSERINLLFADNERGKSFWIRLCNKDLPLAASAPNGHFQSMLTIPAYEVAQCASEGYLSFHLLTAPDDKRQFFGRVRLLAPLGTSIISDIDDTVKITEVTNRAALMNNTFYQPFQAVPGMPEAYRQLAQLGLQFHFVSSSPWQLYPVLEAFRQQSMLPPASYALKNVRFRDTDFFNLFKSGKETKPAQIESILQRFPQRHFILIGDSGEQDPEVYAQMLRRYPQQVLGFAIRLLDGANQQARFDALLQGLDTRRILLFNDPVQLPEFVAALQRS